MLASRSISVGIGPVTPEHVAVKRPHRLIDGPIVTVDQQGPPPCILPCRKSGQMDFADMLQRQPLKIIVRVALMIGAAHVNVAHVEQ